MEILTNVLSVAYQVTLQISVRKKNSYGNVIIVIASLHRGLVVLSMRNHVRKLQQQVPVTVVDAKAIIHQIVMLKPTKKGISWIKNGIILHFLSFW